MHPVISCELATAEIADFRRHRSSWAGTQASRMRRERGTNPPADRRAADRTRRAQALPGARA